MSSNLRTQRLQPLVDKLREISRRGWPSCSEQVAAAAERRLDGTRDELRDELRYLMRITLDSPAELRRRIARIDASAAATTTPPSASSRPATCGWSSRSPKTTATAA